MCLEFSEQKKSIRGGRIGIFYIFENFCFGEEEGG